MWFAHPTKKRRRETNTKMLKDKPCHPNFGEILPILCSPKRSNSALPHSHLARATRQDPATRFHVETMRFVPPNGVEDCDDAMRLLVFSWFGRSDRDNFLSKVALGCWEFRFQHVWTLNSTIAKVERFQTKSLASSKQKSQHCYSAMSCCRDISSSAMSV